MSWHSAAVVHVAQPLDALYQVFAQAQRVIAFTLASLLVVALALNWREITTRRA